MDLESHASVQGFFHEIVGEALRDSEVQASSVTEKYLVHLLGEYASARITDEPLSLKLVTKSEPAERIRALKEVGDTTLYITGFFAESMTRKIVDIDYYVGLGEAAYAELGRRFQSQSNMGCVYTELAQKFPEFVDVLSCARSLVSFGNDDIVSLYSAWQQSRSKWMAKRLRLAGVAINENEPKQ